MKALLFASILCALINPTFQGHSHGAEGGCQPQFPCKVCGTSPQDCKGCVQGEGRSDDKLPACPCLDGFYERGQGNPDCAKCVSPCQTCVNDKKCFKQEHILQLFKNEKIIFSFCAACVQQGQGRKPAPDCGCLDNYYESAGICSICNYKCGACKNSATNCTACKVETGRSSRAPDCNCSSGYYQPEGLNKPCAKCEYPCQTCEKEPTNCLTCGFEPERRKEAPFCTCKERYFEKEQYCHNCAPQCENCSDSPKNCTTCVLNSTRNQDALACSCKDGYFDDGINIDCALCDSKCQTCSESASNCSTCAGNLDNREASPLCTCSRGYYDLNLTCVKCDKICTECTGSAKNCTACASGVQRSGQSPICGCNDRFYEKDGALNCEPCEYPCVTCTGTANNCLTCSYGVNRNSPPECNCGISTYEMDQVCHLCDYRCLKCGGPGRVCTECKFGYQRNMKIGECGCNDGFFDNGRSIDCQPCQYPCATCEEKHDKCLTCGFGVNRIEPPQCFCQPGFLEKNQYCVNECEARCKTCEDLVKSQCIVCSAEFNFFAVKPNGKKLCYSKCPNGFKSDPTNMTADYETPCICETDNCELKQIIDTYTPAGIGYTTIDEKVVKCKQNGCINCDGNENSCNECETKFFLNPQKICERCHPSCNSCYGPTNAECFTCSSLTWNSFSTGNSQGYKTVCPDLFTQEDDTAHRRHLDENFMRGLSEYDQQDCFNLDINHTQCQLNATKTKKLVERTIPQEFQFKMGNALWSEISMSNVQIENKCRKSTIFGKNFEINEYEYQQSKLGQKGADVSLLSVILSQVVGNIKDAKKARYTPKTLNEFFLQDLNKDKIQVKTEILPYGDETNNYGGELAKCYYEPKHTFQIGDYNIEIGEDVDLKADVQSSDIDNSQCYNTDASQFKVVKKLFKNTDPNLFFIVDICTTDKKVVKGLFLKKGVPVSAEEKKKGIKDIIDGEDGETKYGAEFYEFYDVSDENSQRSPFELTTVDADHATNKLLRISHVKVIRKEFQESIVQDVIDKYDRKFKNQECTLEPLNVISDQIMTILKNQHCAQLGPLSELPQGTAGQMKYSFIQRSVLNKLKRVFSNIGSELVQVTQGIRSIFQLYVLNNWYKNNCDCNVKVGDESVDTAFTKGTRVKIGRSKTTSCMYGGKYRQQMEREGFTWKGGERATEYEGTVTGDLDLAKEQIKIFQELWNLNNENDQITVDGLLGNETEYRISITPLTGFVKTTSPKFTATSCRALETPNPKAYSHNQAKEYYYYAKMSYCKQRDIQNWSCEVCKSRERLIQISVASQDVRLADFKHQGVVGYLQSKNLIVISFRGGQSTRNWTSNLNSFFKKRLSYCYKCKGHRGYYGGWSKLRQEVYQAYEDVRRRHPTAKLLVTGHSIGGAIAAFAALDFIERGIIVDDLYLYGSPQIGNVELVHYLQRVIPNTYHVVNQNDIIPFLPYQSKSYNRFVKEYWYNSTGSSYKTCTNNQGVVDPACFNTFSTYSLSKHYNYFSYHTKCELHFMKQLQEIVKKPWKHVVLSSNDQAELTQIVNQYEPPQPAQNTNTNSGTNTNTNSGTRTNTNSGTRTTGGK